MSEDNAVDRRRLLRRASTVAAGLGAAGVASAVAATPANAAAGDPVLLGDNDAGAATTSITSSSNASTLTLSNTGNGAPIVLPSKQLPTNGDAIVDGGVYNFGGYLYYGYAGGLASIYDDSWSTMTMPLVAPERILDTRSAAGRASVINKAVLDSAGRVKEGQTVHVRLTPISGANTGLKIAVGASAMHGNVTVTGPVKPGYLSVFPYGKPRPVASNINFVANQTIANSVFAGVNYYGAADIDVVSIYAFVTTHVILDVSGIVGNQYNVTEIFLPPVQNVAGVRAAGRVHPRTRLS
ncbi:hypothetical protein AB0H43_07500 [Hamadaea sp. NPDC050747]|uniref:hypothetical protein n=1 Tax=Hamadaea sp. NPDC050747 TaxID=3155789 RepID=UPI0033DC7525